jgi:hypothetical protein
MKKTLYFIFVCLLVSLTSHAEASASIDSLYNIYLEANGNQDPEVAHGLLKARYDAGSLAGWDGFHNRN